MHFSGFPREVIEIICWYANENAVSLLLFTGDRALRSRLLQTRNLSSSWTSGEYLDWNFCLPFIKQFKLLQSLRLTTWNPNLIPVEHFNIKILPSTLIDLSLHFEDALRVLMDPELFLHFKSLTSIDIFQPKFLNPSNQDPHLRLNRFPPQLRHLSLVCESQCWRYSTDDLESLPIQLLSLKICLKPSVRNSGQLVILNLPHLVSLDINIWFNIDLTSCAATMRNLKVEKSHVFVNNLPLISTSRPLRKVMPVLESLYLDTSITFGLLRLATLPPTLTRLSLSLSRTHGRSAEAGCFHRLNEERLNFKGDNPLDAPGAPLQLRQLTNLDHFSAVEPSLLRYFSNLESYSVNCLKDCQSLPNGSTSLHVRTLFLNELQQLPAGLKTLSCEYLGHSSGKNVPQEMPFDFDPALSFPKLESLSLGAGFNPWLMSLFPASLVSLELCGVSTQKLKTFCKVVNENELLPLLRDLHLNNSTQTSSTIGLSALMVLNMEVVPLTLKVLRISGRVILDDLTNAPSLKLHPQLTDLQFNSDVSLVDLIPHLPPSLTRLRALLQHCINPIVPKEYEAMIEFSKCLPRLRTLDLVGKVKRHSLVLPHLDTKRTPSITTLFALPWRLSLLFIVLRLRNMRLASQHAVYLAAENFVLSCLPRSLVHIRIPFELFSSMHAQSKRSNFPYDKLNRLFRVWRHGSFYLPFLAPLLSILMDEGYPNLNVIAQHQWSRYAPFPPKMALLQAHGENENHSQYVSSIYSKRHRFKRFNPQDCAHIKDNALTKFRGTIFSLFVYHAAYPLACCLIAPFCFPENTYDRMGTCLSLLGSALGAFVHGRRYLRLKQTSLLKVIKTRAFGIRMLQSVLFHVITRLCFTNALLVGSWPVAGALLIGATILHTLMICYCEQTPDPVMD